MARMVRTCFLRHCVTGHACVAHRQCCLSRDASSRCSQEEIRKFQRTKTAIERAGKDMGHLLKTCNEIKKMCSRMEEQGLESLPSAELRPTLAKLANQVHAHTWEILQGMLPKFNLARVHNLLEKIGHSREHRQSDLSIFDLDNDNIKKNEMLLLVSGLHDTIEKLNVAMIQSDERLKGIEQLKKRYRDSVMSADSRKSGRRPSVQRIAQLRGAVSKESLMRAQPWYQKQAWSFLFKYYKVWWWEVRLLHVHCSFLSQIHCDSLLRQIDALLSVHSALSRHSLTCSQSRDLRSLISDRRVALSDPQVFESYRRVLLSGGLVIFEAGSSYQQFAGLVICLASLKVFINNRPMIEGFDNTLYGRSLWATLMVSLSPTLCCRAVANC